MLYLRLVWKVSTMAIHKLIMDDFDSADYILIAIHSSLEDYRLAYFVNRGLDIRLERCIKDLGVKQKNDLAFFSRYTFEDPYQDTAWNLIRNKESITAAHTNTASLFAGQEYNVSTSVFLLPELKTADYVLKIDNAEQQDATIVQSLLMVKQIATAYKVDHYKLKSKNNLIF